MKLFLVTFAVLSLAMVSICFERTFFGTVLNVSILIRHSTPVQINFLNTFLFLQIGHGYAIEDEPEFSDIDLFTRFPISDEFIKCIRVRYLKSIISLKDRQFSHYYCFPFPFCLKKGVTKIVDKNRDIDWWFKDIVKTAWRLIAEEGLDCAIKSGLSQE